jgi:hypothetical protein
VIAAGEVATVVRRRLRGVFTRRPESMDATVRGFHLRDPWKVDRVRAIVRAFLGGYNAMVMADRPADVYRAVDAMERFYRPFALEGAAMGFGPWAWAAGRDLADFEPEWVRLALHTIYQDYVGLGWWLGMRWRRRPT